METTATTTTNTATRVGKSLSVAQVYSKKPKPSFHFEEELWRKVLGCPPKSGVWLIFGKEKNGKTTLALTLAKMLSLKEKVLYVSAEEDLDDPLFQATLKRVGLSEGNMNLKFNEYMQYETLIDKCSTRQRPEKIVFIDNLTIYKEEIKTNHIRDMIRLFPDFLFVILAHEDDKQEPSGAVGKHVRKLAKIIMHVKGLACFVSGRGCPGGELVINEEKAKIFHRNDITDSQQY